MPWIYLDTNDPLYHLVNPSWFTLGSGSLRLRFNEEIVSAFVFSDVLNEMCSLAPRILGWHRLFSLSHWHFDLITLWIVVFNNVQSMHCSCSNGTPVNTPACWGCVLYSYDVLWSFMWHQDMARVVQDVKYKFYYYLQILCKLLLLRDPFGIGSRLFISSAI